MYTSSAAVFRLVFRFIPSHVSTTRTDDGIPLWKYPARRKLHNVYIYTYIRTRYDWFPFVPMFCPSPRVLVLERCPRETRSGYFSRAISTAAHTRTRRFINSNHPDSYTCPISSQITSYTYPSYLCTLIRIQGVSSRTRCFPTWLFNKNLSSYTHRNIGVLLTSR